MEYNGIPSKHYSQKKLISDFNMRVEYTCHVENLAYYIKKVSAIFMVCYPPLKKTNDIFSTEVNDVFFMFVKKTRVHLG